MRIDPFWKGIGEILGVVALMVAVYTFAFRGLGYPAPDLMYTIAQVGVTILFGFIVEAVWLVSVVDHDDDHENWLGTTCGFGIAGLVGVAFALAVGGHRAAGHGNLLDDLGLWWSVTSLSMLGGLVIVRPLLADRHRSKNEGKSAS